MQARLALCDERDPRSAMLGVGDPSSFDSCLAHLALLRAAPSVRMRQYVHDVVFERRPDFLPVSLADIGFRTVKEVFHEIGENIDDGLVWG